MGAQGRGEKSSLGQRGGGRRRKRGRKETGKKDLSNPKMLFPFSRHHLIRETKLWRSERLLFQLIPHHGFSSGLAFGYLH